MGVLAVGGEWVLGVAVGGGEGLWNWDTRWGGDWGLGLRVLWREDVTVKQLKQGQVHVWRKEEEEEEEEDAAKEEEEAEEEKRVQTG